MNDTLTWQNIKANDAFYEWEFEKFGNNSPLSDTDREIWVEGYLRALNSKGENNA